MIARLGDWWRLRSPREQRLLLVMAALFAITFLWLGLLRPLGDRLAVARERHASAVLALAAIRAEADSIIALEHRTRPPAGIAVAALAQRAAGEAGFTDATVNPDGPDRANITIGAVRAPPFFGWIADLQRRYGLVVDRLSARTNSDRTLAVDLGLKARAR